MKSKFLNRREVLILGLPFLLIGLGGVLLTAREKQRIARESGPLRTIITSIRVEEVTPFEVWQGFDHKIVMDTESQGELGNAPANGERKVDLRYGEVYLEGQINGRKVIRRDGDKVGDGASETDKARGVLRTSIGGINEPRKRVIFLVNTQAFPQGELRLKGFVKSNAYWQKELTSAPLAFGTAPPTAFNTLVRRSDETIAPNIDRTTVQVISTRSIAYSPSSAHTGMFDGNGETLIEAVLKPPPAWKTWKNIYPSGPSGTGIYNAKGKKLPTTEGVIRPSNGADRA